MNPVTKFTVVGIPTFPHVYEKTLYVRLVADVNFVTG